MKTPDSYPRSVAQGGLTIGGRPSPCETGELAEGVPRRLCLLKEGRGLNGKAFSEAVAAGPRQVLRWRAGTVPGGVELVLRQREA